MKNGPTTSNPGNEDPVETVETPRFSCAKEGQEGEVGRRDHGHSVLRYRRNASSGLFRKGAHHYRIILCRSLEQLGDKIKEERREMLTNRVLLHQGNALAHKSALAMAAAHQFGFQLVEHLLHFPDLAPSDYYLFPKMKKELSGHYFPSDGDVMNPVRGFLEDQDKIFYVEGMRKLKGRWTKCVNMQGDYVEK